MDSASEPLFSELLKKHAIDTSSSQVFNSALDKQLTLHDILTAICQKLHPLFSIDCAVILIYDEQVNVIMEALISKLDAGTQVVITEVMVQPSELSSFQKLIADFNFPFLKTKDEWIEEENNNHCLVNGDNHYQFHCYIPLEVNNQVLGTLELHNHSRELGTECLTFCSSIADLIADYINCARITDRENPATAAKSTGVQDDNAIITKSMASQEPKNAASSEHLEQIDNAVSLEEFIGKTAKLFPKAYQNIKNQIEEVLNFKQQLEDEQLQENSEALYENQYPGIIGSGRGMRQVFSLLDKVSRSESTVLILGETGTGKELVAQATHLNSERKEQPMIKVNCAAIPPNLIESELFGHEKGAFTGAMDKRLGKFELADKGTLFLDEVGELPLDMQVKLLRAIQEKEIERVGGKNIIKVDVRIISATNRNLLEEVEQGRFRADLYYRLNVFPISLPSLRDRKEDIALLAGHFLTKFAQKTKKNITGFTQGAIKEMAGYNWPGNVREMEHLIERHVLLTKKPVISSLNLSIAARTLNKDGAATHSIKTIDDNERDHIFAVLHLCNGRVSGPNGAARFLGVPTTTLNSKIKRLGMNKKYI